MKKYYVILLLTSLFCLSLQAQKYPTPWGIYVRQVNTNIPPITVEIPSGANTNCIQAISNGIVLFSISKGGSIVGVGPSNYFSGVTRQDGAFIVTNNTTFIGTFNFPTDLGGPLIDVSVTSATAGATKIGYTNRIDGNDVVRHYANSDGSGAVTNAIVEIPYGVQLSPLGNTNYTVYAAGTAYTLTATPALLDFGTTDPSLTLAQAGTYLLFANAGVKYTGATYAGAQTIALKLRRTNNTAADVANGSRSVELPVLTAFTGGDSMSLPPVIYTATAGDIIQIFGSVSATPSAGSVVTDSAEIVALRIQ